MSTYVTLAEAKTHLRVDFAADDTYIQALIDMVEQMLLLELQGEAYHKFTGTITTANTTALTGTGTNFTDFKVGDIIHVEGDTSRIIATITDDTTGTVTAAFTGVLTDVAYRVYTGLPEIKEDGSFPLALKHAINIMVGHYYMLREPVLIGAAIQEVPFSFKYLISQFKTWTVT